MTFRRSRAYGRIVRGLRTSPALEQISAEQRERLPDAADTLVLAEFCDEATPVALASAHATLSPNQRLRAMDRRARHLHDAGPALLRRGGHPLANRAPGPHQPRRDDG
jgi:hypothetical protein